MWKAMTFVFGGLLASVILLYGYFFVKGADGGLLDGRRVIRLDVNERNLVLGEMRLMLKAVNGVIDGLAKSDQGVAAQAAGSAGMAMAVDLDPVLMGKLPLDFKTLGLGTHALFDDLAKQIQAGAPPEQVLRGLTQITSRCVACHEANQLGVSQRRSAQEFGERVFVAGRRR